MTSKKIPPFFGLPEEWKYEMRVKDEHIEALRDQIATLTAERDRYREALEKVEPWMGQPFADMDEMTYGPLREEWFDVPSCSWEYWLIEKMQNTFRAILNALEKGAEL